MEKKDRIEILMEDMQSNFKLVLEGHAVLNNKIDHLAQETSERFEMVDAKLNLLNQKIDAVAKDLAAHRADTEIHRAPYRVSET